MENDINGQVNFAQQQAEAAQKEKQNIAIKMHIKKQVKKEVAKLPLLLRT